MKVKTLERQARSIRKIVLEMSYRSQVGHLGSAFSIIDILTVLYFDILRVNPKKPAWPQRDRFILSKGHAANALYAILAERGFFPKRWLATFCQDGGRLGVHPDQTIPGVEWTTGSLGHGLSVGCGIALALRAKVKNEKLKVKNTTSHPHSSLLTPRYLLPRVFVLLSDAECQEGSVWEAALFGSQHKLDNLIAIIDYNKVQAFGAIKEILDLEPLVAKWQAFGWKTVEVDGHDVNGLIKALSSLPQVGRPTIVIAKTVRGKGVSFMEHDMRWHYVAPNKEEYEQALKEL